MATLIYSERVLEDIARLAVFLEPDDPKAAAATVDIIESGLVILRQHPLVGRAVGGDLRELVISRGRSGYVALYRYDERDDAVTVVAIRHQREAGFKA